MKRRDFLKTLLSSGAALTGLAASEAMFIPFAEALDVPAFSFAHITDLHLDVKGESNWQYRQKSVPLFIDALREVVRLPKLSFIVFGGDQIHYGPNDKASLAVFHEWIKQIKAPLYILLGNTEVSPVSGVSNLGRDEYLKAWSGMGVRPGRSSWTFDPANGVRVIGWDVTVDGKPYGEARPEALSWLEKELAAGKKKKLIILFTHQVLMPTTQQDTGSLWSVWMVKNHAQVREVLKGHSNVRLAISGHHHAARVQTEGRIAYVSDPATVTYPCAFRMYTVGRDGIRINLVGFNDTETVNRARELLIADPYARIYDPNDPSKAAEYSAGLTQGDRETMIRL